MYVAIIHGLQDWMFVVIHNLFGPITEPLVVVLIFTIAVATLTDLTGLQR